MNILHKHEIYFSNTSRKLEKEDVEILYDIHNLILKSDNNLKPYESYILDKIFEDGDLFLENESLITKAIILLSNQNKSFNISKLSFSFSSFFQSKTINYYFIILFY